MKVAHGVFGWEGEERRSDRYGAIHLSGAPYGGEPLTTVFFEMGALERLHGRRVKIATVVTEARKSQHVGDLFHGIFPSTPAVGERVEIGVGVLDLEPSYEETPDIVLRPNDGRAHLWMDPRKLYRLHDQTVDVFIEETTDDFHPRPDLEAIEQVAACDNGDGTFQTKNTKPDDRILPRMKKLGDGMFIIEPQPGKGERLEVSRGDVSFRTHHGRKGSR